MKWEKFSFQIMDIKSFFSKCQMKISSFLHFVCGRKVSSSKQKPEGEHYISLHSGDKPHFVRFPDYAV